jgi:hypothetical protein
MLDSFRFQRRLTTSAAASALLLAAVACGGGGGTGAGGATTSSTTTEGTTSLGTGGSTGGSGGTGGVAPTCDAPPGYGGAGTALNVASGTSIVDDLSGAPLKQVHVELCGTDICFTGQTNDAGSASVVVNKPMKKPAWKFGDALQYARLAVPITQATTDLGTLYTSALPATGAPLVAGKDATSGGVTLEVAAPVSISFDFSLGYDSPETQAFRAVALPIDKQSAVLAPTGQAPQLLFGVSPAETVFCPPVKVTVAIPDSAKASLPASAQVEFWVLGLDPGQAYAPYGAWQKISDGVVSADGATVSTVDGGGFPFLESFFILKKP